VRRIRKATDGDRNNTLNRESFAIGRLVHLLGVDRARDVLLNATQSAESVLPSGEAERTVDHGLKDGARHPIYTDQNWHAGISWSADRVTARQCTANVYAAVSQHTDLQGILAYDERKSLVLVDQDPPWDSYDACPRAWTDEDSVRATSWLAKLEPSIIATPSQVHEVAATVAKVASSDPFKDWLNGLVWDGESRLDQVMHELCAARDTELNKVFFRRWMIAACARTYEPGCKVDTMLVLVGAQALGKSSFLSALVPDVGYYTGRIPKGDKDQLLALQGPVIVDDGELRNYGAREIEELKAFITEQQDFFRPPYGRRVTPHPRRVVLAATTNKANFLRDETGGRRFWPISVHDRVSFELIPLIRDQLWAEAVERYRKGEQWWLTEPEEKLAGDLQESHRERDPIEEILQTRLDETYRPGENLGLLESQLKDGRLIKISISQACRLANIAHYDRSGSVRLAKALVALGWEFEGRKQLKGERDSWYVKNER
jgi:predicted P-loop ATPase